MPLSNKSPRVKDAASPHRCPECDRAYERPDHLARHLDSHRNERAFQCPICHRGFNRRDVLQRHQHMHAGETSTTRHKMRAIEACHHCAAAKASCDNSNPCERCQRKGLRCVSRRSGGQRNKGTASPRPEAKDPQSQSGGEVDLNGSSTPSPFSFDNTQQINQRQPYVENGTVVPSLTRVCSLRQSPDVEDDSHGLSNFPAFFEQVMMAPNLSPLPGLSEVQQPRGIFDFMCEPQSASPDAALFGSDMLADLDKIFECFPSHPDASNGEQSTKQRVAAFRKSLWLWVPEKNQNGFSEMGYIPLTDGDMTASISSLHRSRLEALGIRDKLTNKLRDNIFQLVLSTGGSRLSVPSFPTAESLDALIKIGISKRTETDAWIHPYTLYRQDPLPELLTALVAAGCVCSAVRSINKAGVLLLEIVRLGLAQLAESDNSVLRDLQYFQASMLWLEIGVFCGYKRRMQIAESHLQPLCTALRRAGAFDRSYYSSIQPVNGFNEEDALETTWLQWIRQESLKRLVYHLFEHDVETAAAMNRPGLTSYTELTLPFPSARDLWLAPTAAAWKRLWETKYAHAVTSDLSLRELLADLSILNTLPVIVDAGVVNSALLHGLMSQVWVFRQQALLNHSCRTDTRAMTQLWLQSRQEDLLLSIQKAKEDMANSPSTTTLFGEFTLMHLHVSFDSVQRFAGQFGETEARREYLKLRDWSLTKEARISIWHAGQLLRAARLVPPFHLRGFDILAIYHSVLILWVFGLLWCGETYREVPTGQPNAHLDPLIALDGEETDSIKAFINRGIGRPGLNLHSVGTDEQHSTVFCPLRSPRSVMDVGRQVFDSNFPGATDNMPPLVDNLRDLIQELGNLP